MNMQKAQMTAKRYNRFVKDPKISYEAIEIRPKVNPYEDDGELLVSRYQVVQKYDGNIVWYLWRDNFFTKQFSYFSPYGILRI